MFEYLNTIATESPLHSALKSYYSFSLVRKILQAFILEKNDMIAFPSQEGT